MRYPLAIVWSCCLALGCQRQEATPGSVPPNEGQTPAPTASLRPKPVTPPDAVASQNTNWGTVVADVQEFKRKGNVLTAVGRFRGGGLIELNLSSAYILDEAQGRKYKALVDETGDVIGCCHGGRLLSSPDTLAFWVKFPAPPPDVKAITLVFPQTTPFESLAIQDQ